MWLPKDALIINKITTGETSHAIVKGVLVGNF